MFQKNEKIAVIFAYCTIVIVLMGMAPWIDWARYGNAWVANLAGLPVLPAVILLISKRLKFA